MYPGIYGPVGYVDDQNDSLPSYLSAQEAASVKNPGPDAYALQRSGYDADSGAEYAYGNARIRPSLLPATAKYPRQAPSIPRIQGGVPAERAAPMRPVRPEPFRLQIERPEPGGVKTDFPAVGQYNVRVNDFETGKSANPGQSTRGSAPFASRTARGIYAHIKDLEREVVRQEQNRRRYAEDQAERR